MRRSPWTALVALIALAAGSGRAEGATGLVPLTQLGSDPYLGFPGGLYPGGADEPPAAHATLAGQLAAAVLPRAAEGAPDPTGRIGFLAIGMSNTNQEFKAFERLADPDARRDPRIVLVNGAVGGMGAETIADPASPYWSILDGRLAAAGLAPAQVQVVWLKQIQGIPSTTAFPGHAEELRDLLGMIARILRGRFPNLQLAFLASRSFGDYAETNPLRREPIAYETGFGVKWVIEAQIAGDPDLNADPTAGPVEAPLLLWGPYLWADGEVPREPDGLTWLREDYEADGIHPSPAGEAKVAALLASFFGSHPATRRWYLARPFARLVVLPVAADATVDSASPDIAYGVAPELRPRGGASPAWALLRFPLDLLGGVPPLHAKLSLRNITGIAEGGMVARVEDDSWQEGTVTWSTRPLPSGAGAPLASWSSDSALAVDLTAEVAAEADTALSLALLVADSSTRRLLAREGGEPPQLVVALPALFVDGLERGDLGAWSRVSEE
ncbi:MAG TPA: DNRLRE domain-containing protein [Thermoanaerobaculia bacterium]|nr:DNRLRE domain-containing protein [Thermoanaerobaculia bacterium]